MGDWKTHSMSEGPWKCNVYSRTVKEGNLLSLKTKIEQLRADKYVFYLSRFNNHEQSILSTLKLLPIVEDRIKFLTENQVIFIILL